MADLQLYGPYGGKQKRDFYETLLGALKTERASFDAHWAEIGEWIQPHRVRFVVSDRNKGDKRRQSIIDSSVAFAARTLQSGLHAGLTSPARPWFKLTTPDPELADFGPVKQWLHTVTTRMRTVFGQTNLYNALPVVYGDLGSFGTAAAAILEDERDLFRAYTFPIGSYVLAMDARGRATVFMREYQLTVRQIVEQFGGPAGRPAVQGQPIEWGQISGAVKRLWDTGTYETPVTIVWVVAPNPEADASRLGARWFPWTSCYFERGGEGRDRELLLRESGFRTFPVLAPRWDVTGEDAYGRECPGMIALGDVKQLQIMQRQKGRAIAKKVDPPLTAPVALRTQKTSLLPGDITYVDVREGMQGVQPIYEVGLTVAELVDDMRETRYRIQRAFYEDLFLMLAQSDQFGGADRPTAREIEERHEEKLLALGPVLERTNDELLDPLIDRVYALLEEKSRPDWERGEPGLIPQPPDELDGVALKVEYVSVMAQAQKLVGVIGQDRFLQTVGAMVQANPALRHKVDWNQLVDNYAEMLGVDPRIVVPTAAANEAAAREARQAAAVTAAQVAAEGARAAKLASETPLGRDSALDRVIAGVAG